MSHTLNSKSSYILVDCQYIGRPQSSYRLRQMAEAGLLENVYISHVCSLPALESSCDVLICRAASIHCGTGRAKSSMFDELHQRARDRCKSTLRCTSTTTAPPSLQPLLSPKDDSHLIAPAHAEPAVTASGAADKTGARRGRQRLVRASPSPP